VSRGFFVVVEGPDGVGKSTLCHALLAHYGNRVRGTAEPSAGPTGRYIRRILGGKVAMPGPEAMVELFALDRLEHVGESILPALRAGWLVICSRYVLSSIAFQSGDQVPVARVTRANRYAPPADLTLVLMASGETCAGRRAARSGAEAFETTEAQERAQRIYEAADRYLPGQVEILDGAMTAEQVLAEAIECIDHVRAGYR
jgi:dTMP kinase